MSAYEAQKEARLVHKLPAELLKRPVSVHLVGCGGTGSQMLTHLCRLHLAMVALGHPAGLHVTAFDPDVVTRANIGRQLFSQADLGRHKSDVLINRINNYFGTTWLSFPGRYEVIGTHPQAPTCDIVITCVDTGAARRKIGAELSRMLWRAPIYWLDMGNGRDEGQVVLTELREPIARQTIATEQAAGNTHGYGAIGYKPDEDRTDAILPPLWVVNEDMFREDYEEDDVPSCSLAEALQEQGLFINAQIAVSAAQILEQLFRFGEITEYGYVINMAPGIPYKVLPYVVKPPEEHIAAMLGGKAATNG